MLIIYTMEAVRSFTMDFYVKEAGVSEMFVGVCVYESSKKLKWKYKIARTRLRFYQV